MKILSPEQWMSTVAPEEHIKVCSHKHELKYMGPYDEEWICD